MINESLMPPTARLFLGKYRGTVADNEDPRHQGRIRAFLPEVLGEVQTGWALPCAPYGFFAIPARGKGVWIEFEAGHVSRPIWSGCWWSEGEAPGGGDPKRKVWRTDAGHTITLDDDGETIEIADGNGAKVSLGSAGIKLEKGGGSVEVSDGVVKVNGGSLEVT
ncbi:MAG: phage baseplate assembly protein V [Planctomycetota bacterium]